MRPTPHPFPHLILDGFADAAELGAANTVWPAPSWPGWVQYTEAHHAKAASDLGAVIPAPCAALLYRMARVDVSAFGPGLVPDLGLYGGGLHELRQDQSVGVHLDASHHARLGLSRKLTAILYLSPWEGGGELTLWDSLSTVRIAPLPGRLVLFENGERSLHSVAPVAAGVRRSVALFFYGSPEVGPRPRAHFLTDRTPGASWSGETPRAGGHPASR